MRRRIPCRTPKVNLRQHEARTAPLSRVWIGLYAILWIVTAVWGTSSVEVAFDQEFAVGFPGLAGNPEAMVRIPYIPALRDPTGSWPGTARVWRARSRGIAVAPFVLVDAAAWLESGLSGFSGYRVIFWFFGESKWVPIWCFWAA